jgi:hypothetical protein
MSMGKGSVGARPPGAYDSLPDDAMPINLRSDDEVRSTMSFG